MTLTLDRTTLLRRARAAWDNAVIAYRFDMAASGRSTYGPALERLDDAWNVALLPLPWFPSMIARGDLEVRPAGYDPLAYLHRLAV